MDQHRLTESACRAIGQAANLAVAAGHQAVEPLHLLWALVQEESNASAILGSCGFSLDTLRDACPLDTDSGDEQVVARRTVTAEATPQSPALQDVVGEAWRLGGLMGRHAQIGSEHLLCGLAAVDSPVKQVLGEHGIDAEMLVAQLTETSGLTAEPLDVDFSIAWREPSETDHSDTCRIIDAAANRAREGLRVVEDFVRFTLDDAHLTGLLKQCRHDLAQAVATLDSSALLASRETLQDVGTGITTQTEAIRRSPLDVATANFKRAEEAIRTLEEFGKILSPTLSGQLEQLRYRLYAVEKAILRTHANRQRWEGRNLYLILTEGLCHHGLEPAVRNAIAAGAAVVQVREKSMADRQLIEHGRRVRQWTREAGALLIINDRADLAVLTHADGVHVGQDELTVREARRIVGPDRLVGLSTHTIEQARQAVLDGADYIGVGPVFPSTTKKFDEYAGLELVRLVAAEITLPWFAIGGIDADNIGEAIAAGASRVAVSGAICGAEHPADTTRQLTALLGRQS